MIEKKEIKFSPPDISDEEINEVVDTLKSGWITTGPKTKLFEKEIANYCDTEKAVAFSSATAAMEMALRYLGIGIGDEVITSAYTYTASASVITHVGAKIVFTDVAKDSFHIDYDSLESLITPKTKAIIPVDIGGVMADYDKIYDIVEKLKNKFIPSNKIQEKFGRIIILGDGAHSFGAKYKGEKSGAVADFTAFSFHAVKNLTTAEGGALTWRRIPEISNDEIYNQLMLFSLHGQSKDALSKTKLGAWEYDIIGPYYKCNMTDIMASIGLAQLKRFNALLNKRESIIKNYDDLLANSNLDSLKHYSELKTSSGHLYLLRLLGKDEKYRNNLIIKLADKGIATNVHYKPLPMMTAYKNLGFNINNYPNSYNMFKNEVTLPLHTKLSIDDVCYIKDSLISSL